jgi:formylglycine-generating enzyme required for sulfatase activity
VGDVLGEMGDPRFGVGVKAGIPEIDWCDVPAGLFVMGGSDLYSAPRHEVHLPAFKISRYPITGMQYQAFLEAPGGYRNPVWWNGLHEESRPQRLRRLSQPMIPNHPVENVSWYEAMAFCAWLSARSGGVVRLPTEAEWEKAARGTDERAYPWGNRYTVGCGNIDERWGNAYSLKQTTAVGLYPQGTSPYGAQDMSGNVWEWTLTDYWQPNRLDLSTDAPRAVRGGSWNSYESFARTTCRHTRPADFCGHDVGFRVVMGDPG